MFISIFDNRKVEIEKNDEHEGDFNMKREVKTLCDVCGNKCGVIVTIEDDRATSIRGDEEDKVSRGRLCIKGQKSLEVLYNKRRINTPLKRAGKRGEGKWEEISWKDAIDEIGDRFIDLKSKYGAESIFSAYGYSRDFVHTQLIELSTSFGIPNIVSPDYICYSPLMWGYIYTLGYFPKPDINENTKCTILWGVNKFNTRFFEVYDLIEAQKNGMKTIVVDPRKTQHALKADLWLPIRPGTDIYLIYGMIHLIIENKLYDTKWVEKYVVGFDEIAELVYGYTPKVVSKLTGICEKDIIKTVELYMASRPNAIWAGNAFDMNVDSFQKARALGILVALSGSLDVSGGMVDYESKSLTKGRWPYGKEVLSCFTPELKAKRVGAEYIKIPEHYNASPQGVMNAILEGEPYNIRAGFIQASNVVTSWPDTKRTIKALEHLEFLVVSDIFHTPTTNLADIVLPASSHFEYEAVKQALDGSLKLQRIIDTPYNSLPDFEILNRIGRKLKLGGNFENDSDEYWSECISPSGKTIEDIRKSGGCYPYIEIDQKYEKYKLNGFKTETGKVEFYSKKLEKLGSKPIPVVAEEVIEELDGYYNSYITTYKSKLFNNSEGKPIKGLRDIQKYPIAEISRTKALKLGVKNGDWIWIETKVGKIKHVVKAVDGISEDVVIAETGWWDPMDEDEKLFKVLDYSYNNLVSSKKNINSEMSSVSIRGLACRIEKADIDTKECEKSYASVLDMTGLILAGGKGRRMGYLNKAMLPIEGKTFVEKTCEKLDFLKEILVVGQKKNGLSNHRMKWIEDSILGKGPLGGLYTAFERSSEDFIYCIPCDMPKLSSDSLSSFVENEFTEDAIVATIHGEIQPLIGIYKRSLAPKLKCFLDQKTDDFRNYSPKKWFDTLNIRYKPLEIKTKEEVVNINTLDDYKNFIENR